MATSAGSCGGNKNGFQTSVAVGVQPTRCHRFVSANDSSAKHFIFSACVSYYCQSAITPKLTFGSEPMWSSRARNNLRRTNRTYLRDRSQQLNRFVLLSFAQNCSFGSFPKFTDMIKLFIQPGRSLPHSDFGQLL